MRFRTLRIRALTAIATSFASLVLIATATATTQVIPGDGTSNTRKVTISVTDSGQLQAKRGAPGDSVNGMFYGSVPGSEYFHLRLKDGSDEYFVNSNMTQVSNGPVTGNWTPSSPAQVVTVLDAGTKLRVKQTVLYVGFDRKFRVVWEVTNISGATVPFIFGTSADLFIDNSDYGTGVFSDGPSRFVGGTSSSGRVTGGLQEVTSSTLPGEGSATPVARWASFQESGYSSATSRLASFDAYTNMVESSYIDNGVGVSFDDRATTGLAPGQTQRYEVIWHLDRPTPLSASPASASRELPSRHEVVLSLVDANYFALPGQVVRYKIAGANPAAETATVTDALGQVSVAWDGRNAGVDTLTGYVDVNGNGAQDASDPSTSATVNWRADNHVDGAPEVPGTISGPSGSVPVQVQENPSNAEAPTYLFGRSATAAAGFADCTFDQRQGRELNLPVGTTLQPGGGTISNVGLYVTDPSRHDPAGGGALPAPIAPTGNTGNRFNFVVACVVPGEMWVEFTLTEGGNSETFRIPIGGLMLIDPQGVVYDGPRYDAAIAAGQTPDAARAAAAVSGATVRLQRRVGEEFRTLLSGDPGITPNVNPQITGANGIYQWDVSPGTYRVEVAVAGCDVVHSQAVVIPPPVLDLHVRVCDPVPVVQPEPTSQTPTKPAANDTVVPQNAATSRAPGKATRLGPATLIVDAKGTFVVKMRGTSGDSGTAFLETVKKFAAAAGATGTKKPKKPKAAPLALGSKAFKVNTKGTSSLPFTLGRAAKAALAKNGKLVVKVKVVSKYGTSTRTDTFNVTLKPAPKAPAKPKRPKH